MGTERALLPCDCGGCGQAHVSRDGDVEWIACPDCGYQGPLRLSLADAIAAWNQRLSAPPPAAAPVRPDGEREVIARIIALHGLGSTSGAARRVPPNDTWTIAEWHRRILECVPERVEADCYELADAILAALPPRGEEATALTRQAERIAVLEAVARAYLEDAKRWKFDGPGVAAARAALAKEARDG